MTLKQSNAELLLTKGIEQKVSAYVIPDESLLRAENVDFSKVGTASKRSGLEPNSNLVLGAGTLDTVRRLGSRRKNEVLCISETVNQIGSAAGVGYAGDTLYSYSEEAQQWVTRGKMPRPNLDVLWTSGIGTPGNAGFTNYMVTGGVDRYVCIAHQAKAFGQIRVVVVDVGADVASPLREAPTVVIDTTFYAPVQGIAGWAQSGDKVWLFYGQDATDADSTDFAAARAFRSDSVTFDDFETMVDAERPVHCVSSDGTNIFAAFHSGTGGWCVRKYDGGLAVLAERDEPSSLVLHQEIALDARLDWVDLAVHDVFGGGVYTKRMTKGTLNSVTPLTLTCGGISGVTGSFARGNIQICTYSDTQAIVMLGNPTTHQITTTPAWISVFAIDMTVNSVVGQFEHMGLVPYAQPFIVDGRIFFIAMHTSGYVHPNGSLTDLTGTIVGEESFMCFQIPLENLNPLMVPFPSAQWDWGYCVTKNNFGGSAINGCYWVNGKNVYQSSEGVYVTTNIATAAGVSNQDWIPTPRLVRLEFGDAAHRWRTVDTHDTAVFAGGVPFAYDGTRSYELATALHQPVPLAWNVTAEADIDGSLIPTGSLELNKKHFLQTAMLYVDGNGRECWSKPSRIIEVTPVIAGIQAAYVITMPVTTSVKPDMGNFTNGRLRLYLFIAHEDAPNEFFSAMSLDVDPNQLNPCVMYVADFPSPSNTLMYTSGLELDNVPAPPCRSICEHSGRLFAIASDSNKLMYTKPFNSQRGMEFALGQEIPLPEKGIALASLNDRLVVFTTHSVLAVQGEGPDVTGSPPDAYSRPVLITSDYGCVEYNAAARTPLGVVFRGRQGFYLLGMGFDVQYIGAPVEDITRRWIQTHSIVNDQKLGCCRIVGFRSTRTEELCFWYDTKRWSMNTLGDDGAGGFYISDSLVLGDNLLQATTDTTVSVASRYTLGERGTLAYRDYGNTYDQVIETGWLTFSQAGNLKRIWRAYVMCKRSDDASGRVGSAVVRVQVYKDWEESVSSDREFELDNHDQEPRNLRVHLKEQKMRAIKVKVTVRSTHAGVDVMKIGFELGMRQGGPKEVRENTQ